MRLRIEVDRDAAGRWRASVSDLPDVPTAPTGVTCCAPCRFSLCARSRTVSSAVNRPRRLVIDEPIDLPEGVEVELAIVDVPDDLADEEREVLHRAIDAGLDEIDAGLGVDAAEALARLRRG